MKSQNEKLVKIEKLIKDKIADKFIGQFIIHFNNGSPCEIDIIEKTKIKKL